jgi:coenzyme F420 hydrogenase subunit beta
MRTEKVKKESIYKVYSKGLCTGCGTCASACPTSAIQIVRNDRKGIYMPVVDDQLCNGCGLCLEICPGHSVDFRELNLRIFGREPEEPWLGNYIALYVGHASDDEVRRKSSSGGLVTALLLFALEEGIIDGAIVTRMRHDKPLEPEVVVARTREGIISARGSKYCPVPANAKLKDIENEDAKFAIVGLPCHIHGLRKYGLASEEPRGKILLCLGLMCSNNATFLGTEYFLQKHGIAKEDIGRLEYRGEGWLRDYNMIVHLRSGGEKVIPRRGVLFASAFHHDFAAPRCLLCCDHTCELADISFGDPRLPHLMEDKLGKSLVVSRTALGEEILQKAVAEGAIELTERLSVERFFQAQNISFKRGVSSRLSLLAAFGRPIPSYNAAKLRQPAALRHYLDFLLFYLPSYTSHRRCLWPLIRVNALTRACVAGGAAKAVWTGRRLLKLGGAGAREK